MSGLLSREEYQDRKTAGRTGNRGRRIFVNDSSKDLYNAVLTTLSVIMEIASSFR
jgi:hypothetical protein